ncbi:12517_t:CDS:2, partial [Gigaspora rosea]
QEKKYYTGQRSENTRDGKGKEEQGRKTIIESEKINTLQRRLIGKWKERMREETEEKNPVLSSQKLLEKILKRLVRLEERD